MAHYAEQEAEVFVDLRTLGTVQPGFRFVNRHGMIAIANGAGLS